VKPPGSRRKGNRGERELVQLLNEHGIEARRVPLSGSDPNYPGDVIVGNGDDEQTWQVKRRGQGFVRLQRWLQDYDVLAFRTDRGRWLVCLPLDAWLELHPFREARREDSVGPDCSE